MGGPEKGERRDQCSGAYPGHELEAGAGFALRPAREKSGAERSLVRATGDGEVVGGAQTGLSRGRLSLRATLSNKRLRHLLRDGRALAIGPEARVRKAEYGRLIREMLGNCSLSLGSATASQEWHQQQHRCRRGQPRRASKRLRPGAVSHRTTLHRISAAPERNQVYSDRTNFICIADTRHAMPRRGAYVSDIGVHSTCSMRVAPVASMTSRSKPSATPLAGGITASAARKSSSIG